MSEPAAKVYFNCTVCLQLLDEKPIRCPCCGAVTSFAEANPEFVEAWLRRLDRRGVSRRSSNDDDDFVAEPSDHPDDAADPEPPDDEEDEEEDEDEDEEEDEYEEKPLPPPEKVKVKNLYKVKAVDVDRYETGDETFDSVLDGGVPKHRCLMFSGQPGTGKSTLVRQIIAAIANQGVRCLYVSGEEAETKIRLEFKRLGLFKKYPNARHYLQFAYASDPEGIVEAAHEAEIEFLGVDSLGKMRSRRAKGAAGKETQVVHAAVVFQASAHSLGEYEGRPKMTVALITHATKGGDMAGANAAKHETDGAFMLEAIDPVTREPVDDPNVKTGHVRFRVHGKYRDGSDTTFGYYRMTKKDGLVPYHPDDAPEDVARVEEEGRRQNPARPQNALQERVFGPKTRRAPKGATKHQPSRKKLIKR